jgi:hypothetical protein
MSPRHALMNTPLRGATARKDRQTGAISQTLENGLQGYRLILHHLA